MVHQLRFFDPKLYITKFVHDRHLSEFKKHGEVSDAVFTWGHNIEEEYYYMRTSCELKRFDPNDIFGQREEGGKIPHDWLKMDLFYGPYFIKDEQVIGVGPVVLG